MDFGIAGKRAVVVGGSTGLGYAVCEALAAEHVNLLVFSRDEQNLHRCREALRRKFDVAVDICPGDIANEADIDRLAEIAAGFGDVEIVVLNTPRPPSPMRDFLDETEQTRWDDAYRHQLHGALLVLRKLGRLVTLSGWGRVIAITSASVKQPMPRHAVSTIFRAGVQAALKHLAMEVAEHGVTVNSVAPATVLTPTFSTYHDLDARIRAVPLKRAGKPEELGATVAFLASMHAGFISGQVIQMDGGATLSLC
jgi:3-oxoacyl-[acyl-carrier protein] reductase